MTNSAFDDWYDGLVGFHINSERIIDDLNGTGLDYPNDINPITLRRWMSVCWNAAIERCEDYDGVDYSDLKTTLDTL